MAFPTPICDFVRRYAQSGTVRAHMPGHKGKVLLGFEPYDITEIKGADSLYEAEGIIAESEKNTSELYGSGATYFSAEGSSQCIKAMVFLARSLAPKGGRPHILAARNVHKSFVYACALTDTDISWLMPEEGRVSLCSCTVTPEGLEKALSEEKEKPFAVYITAPDYMGYSPDIRGLKNVCERYGVPLLVDNAHGAYLKFLSPSQHPLDMGADMCCDSAHKTLPAVTGAAYLHISKPFAGRLKKSPREALAAFGSTSPSYLILQSLDMCGRYIAEGYREKLADRVKDMDRLKARLRGMGYHVAESDPLKLTVFDGAGGEVLAERLREGHIECEFADKNAVVMMFTPENDISDLEAAEKVFSKYRPEPFDDKELPKLPYPVQKLTVRDAVFAPGIKVPVREAAGRICASPSVSCPPAVPAAVSGEIITEEAVRILLSYGTEEIEVIDI